MATSCLCSTITIFIKCSPWRYDKACQSVCVSEWVGELEENERKSSDHDDNYISIYIYIYINVECS